MRRVRLRAPRLAIAGVLIVLLAGCSVLASNLPGTESPQSTAPIAALSITATPSPHPSPTAEPALLATAQPSIVPLTPTPAFPWLTGTIHVFPGPRHYAGDLISVEVVVENVDQLNDAGAAVLSIDEMPIDAVAYATNSPLREDALVFRWAWDTIDVDPGTYPLQITLPVSQAEQQQTLSTYVRLEPAEDRPAREDLARWGQRLTNCCRLRYLTGTAAERDIVQLAGAVDSAFLVVEERLGLGIANRPVQVTAIDNVWGNGAYIGDQIVVSYVDRAYTGSHLETVFQYEAAHWTMRPYGTSQTPTLLAEGVAVYAAGGHYRPAPLGERAAALLALDQFVPLAELANDFWGQQHEVAYVEAGGLVAYLFETYGRVDFLTLYGLNNVAAESPAAWLDAGFQQVYGASIDQIEAEYVVWLGAQQPGEQVDDLRLTIDLYDTIRRYQGLYAPYQEALPPVDEAIERGIVADYMREPTDIYNIALETMLVSAQDALDDGDLTRVENLLEQINMTLDDGDFTRGDMEDYVALARRANQVGYEAQRINLEDGNATIVAIQNWPQLRTLIMERHDGRWDLQN